MAKHKTHKNDVGYIAEERARRIARATKRTPSPLITDVFPGLAVA